MKAEDTRDKRRMLEQQQYINDQHNGLVIATVFDQSGAYVRRFNLIWPIVGSVVWAWKMRCLITQHFQKTSFTRYKSKHDYLSFKSA